MFYLWKMKNTVRRHVLMLRMKGATENEFVINFMLMDIILHLEIIRLKIPFED